MEKHSLRCGKAGTSSGVPRTVMRVGPEGLRLLDIQVPLGVEQEQRMESEAVMGWRWGVGRHRLGTASSPGLGDKGGSNTCSIWDNCLYLGRGRLGGCCGCHQQEVFDGR